MALEVKVKKLGDISEIINSHSPYNNLKKVTPLNIFNDPRFTYACAEALGYEDIVLLEIFKNNDLIDIIPLVKTRENFWRTPIPEEFPHLNVFPSFSENLLEILNFLTREFKGFSLPYLVLNEKFAENIPKTFKVLKYPILILEVPQDFQRWLYRAKPRSQDKFSKIIKFLNRDEIRLEKESDPLGLSEKISSALNKGSELPILSKAILNTLILQLKIVGFDIHYLSLKADNYEVSGAITLNNGTKTYILKMFNFTDDEKSMFPEIQLLKLMEEAEISGVKELIIFLEKEPPILRYEYLNLISIRFIEGDTK
jgi:hypothetical protein